MEEQRTFEIKGYASDSSPFFLRFFDNGYGNMTLEWRSEACLPRGVSYLQLVCIKRLYWDLAYLASAGSDEIVLLPRVKEYEAEISYRGDNKRGLAFTLSLLSNDGQAHEKKLEIPAGTLDALREFMYTALAPGLATVVKRPAPAFGL